MEKELGHGNFSTVYRAVHRASGKAYAIKKSKKPITTAAEKNQWLAVSIQYWEGHGSAIRLIATLTMPCIL